MLIYRRRNNAELSGLNNSDAAVPSYLRDEVLAENQAMSRERQEYELARNLIDVVSYNVAFFFVSLAFTHSIRCGVVVHRLRH